MAMQTWLPLPGFAESAGVLDDKRLSMNIRDAAELVRINKEGVFEFMEHPAAVMWRNYGLALLMYGQEMCDEWYRRHEEPHGSAPFFLDLLDTYAVNAVVEPPWLGDPMFHACQRSNLLRKDPTFYRRLWPLEADDAVLVWPVVDEDGEYRWRITEADAKKVEEGKRTIYARSEDLL